MEETQNKQEFQYNFPYHYIPKYVGSNFNQVVYLSWGFEYLAYIEFILTKLEKSNFRSIIDIGCGDGRLIFEIKQKFLNKKLQIWGADYSLQALEFARILNKDVCFEVLDITTQHDFFENNKFDVVTLIETLEHIPPDKIPILVKNLEKLVEKNGFVILTVPSINLPLNKKHYQHFDLKKIEKYFCYDFEINNVIYLNKTNLFRDLIQKFLVNKIFIINNQWLLNKIYKFYIKYFLIANERNASRILITLIPKKA